MAGEELEGVIGLLPEVFQHMLRTEDAIQDDTCIEKFCSWLKETAGSKDFLQILLRPESGILHFLSQAAKFSSQQDAPLPTYCFALRLFGILATNVHALQTGDVHQDILCLDTAKQLLSVSSDSWQNVSVRFCWIKVVTELLPIPEWKDLLIKIDAKRKAFQLLSDGSMFVARTAQSFVAKSLIQELLGDSSTESGQLKDVNGRRTEQNVKKRKQEETDLNNEDASPRKFPKVLPFQKDNFCNTLNASDVLEDVNISSNAVAGNTCGHDHNYQISFVSELLREFQRYKKCTLPHQTILKASLGTLDTESRVVSLIAVFETLVSSDPGKGLTFLQGHSLVADLCHMIEGQSSKVSDKAVDLVCLIVQTKRQMSCESAALFIMPEEVYCLPIKLIQAKNLQKAYKVISCLLSSQETPRSKVDMLLSLIFHPFTNLVGVPFSSHPVPEEWKNALQAFQDDRKSGCHELLHHSVVCLERLAKEDSLHIIVPSEDICELEVSVLEFLITQRSSPATNHNKLNKTLKVVVDLIIHTFHEVSGSINKQVLVEHMINLLKPCDCDNTILNKGFSVLGLCLETSPDESVDVIISKVETLIKKHLMNIHWEARDSTLKFLETILKSHGLKMLSLSAYVVDRFEDEQSYVRASALSCLSTVWNSLELRLKFLEYTHLDEVYLLRQVLQIITDDTEAFARRAGVEFMSSLLSQQSCMPKGIENLKQEEIILTAVSIATRDLDWEVKLLSLTCWEKLFTKLFPYFQIARTMSGDCHIGNFDVTPDRERSAEVNYAVNGSHSLNQTESENHGDSGKDTNIDLSTARYELSNGVSNLREIPSYAVNLIPNHSSQPKNIAGTIFIDKAQCSTHVKVSETDKVDEKVRKSDLCLKGLLLLKNYEILDLLLGTLHDEDRSVKQRACQIILHLQNCLVTMVEDTTLLEEEVITQELKTDLFEFLEKIKSERVKEVYRAACEIPEDSIISLLHDMAGDNSVPEDRKVDIDCY